MEKIRLYCNNALFLITLIEDLLNKNIFVIGTVQRNSNDLSKCSIHTHEKATILIKFFIRCNLTLMLYLKNT